LGCGLALLLALSMRARADDESVNCTRKSSHEPPATHDQLKTPVALTASPATEVVNFGSDRGSETFDVVMMANPDLPPDLTADQLYLDAPTRFRRVGENLQSKQLPLPTFTVPEISSDEISFTVCLSGKGADAGRYSGQVRVGGPKGLGRGVVSVTANAKAARGFVIGIILAALGAGALMFFQEIRSHRKKKFGLAFFLQAAVGLAAALGAMYKVYSDDPAWGADIVAAVIALLGTAVTAAGVKTFLESLRS
jgi:hypothetical protein